MLNKATEISTIAEMTNGVILASYEKKNKTNVNYQSEAQLEEKFVSDLVMQGYERLVIKSASELDINLKKQIERLNKIEFSESEWKRFKDAYLDPKNDGKKEKTRKIQEDHLFDFRFDNGHSENIKIIDKKNLHNNFLQVVNQVEQSGTHHNRYDVTILVNGLPLVHVELKRRGVNIAEAFNQIHRYSKESFNSENSLYKYVQIFVISNGTYTRYFANTTKRDKNNYEFTCEWADAKNQIINDLEDFTATFFEKRVLLEVLTKYCVFNKDNVLMIMRPYQIAAVERILWKIQSSYNSKKAGSIEAGGYIWHTTGSGKTLTSFKAARLATSLEYIDKVFFVVDRKDLDSQTMNEYKKFQEDSVNGSKDTKELKKSIEKKDNRIVVTTIQKLNEFIKRNPGHEIYQKQCVLIFDECHRSQFGEAQINIRKAFKKYYQFGFTGTPIFEENALNKMQTTAGVFGAQLHSYVITDAIRDGKVLKFKVDYNNVAAEYKGIENDDESDIEKIKINEEILMHRDRISKITNHILEVYNTKTHRNEYYNLKEKKYNGFNAMFAVSSVAAAKKYYEEFKKQQENIPLEKRLKVATIFSYCANEVQEVKGEIEEEKIDELKLDKSSKEFLEEVINDYNKEFKVNFSIDTFSNYYEDLSKKVKEKEVDLLIVVGMFLTGFDAPKLNTLFVDKNLKYHGLLQAYSRTNRILNKVKSFGNIVCFRDLEKATKDAIKTFGDKNSINVILERSFKEYMFGYIDEDTGKYHKGFNEISEELEEIYPNPESIESESSKKEFVKLFGEYLKTENILRNFDEFYEFEKIINEARKQDLKSIYINLKPELNHLNNKKPEVVIDMSEIEFYIELLKTDEINLDYIFTLIFEKYKETGDKELLKKEVRRILRSTLGLRAKEDLIIKYIEVTNFEELKNIKEITDSFYDFARKEKEIEKNKLKEEENLNNKADDFIEKSLEKGEVNIYGTDFVSILPNVSRINNAMQKKKESVFSKIRRLVEVFVGI